MARAYRRAWEANFQRLDGLLAQMQRRAGKTGSRQNQKRSLEMTEAAPRTGHAHDCHAQRP